MHKPDIVEGIPFPDSITYFTPDGIRVIPRVGDPLSWEWGLTLVGYGYAGDMQPVAAAELVVADNRLAYHRGDVTEWYVNDERGLEQGFTLAAAPESGIGNWESGIGNRGSGPQPMVPSDRYPALGPS